ncbi:MAG: sulfurtransferase [Proteobacteria bacterium]|nr:sulfurtransferase [Pseudomonadota bacterium]MBU1714233.1 sulfurtransferase [Pseudomonadota bacterium]
MRWKQFLTPVKSFDRDQARNFIDSHAPDDHLILDVRQPKEYENGHIPGARLIPMAELPDRIPSLPTDKPILVYCAIGGRSRIAAQMLSGKGLKEVINLTGGFKAWEGLSAFGPREKGLDYFTGLQSAPETLIIAYSLESGLLDFYDTMAAKVKNQAASDLFKKMSGIEITHQARILKEYNRVSATETSREEFEKNILPGIIEGGMTTEEYAGLFQTDLEDLTQIIELAISIEAQALDLYLRAADFSQDKDSKEILSQIAKEEQTHIRLLGDLLAKED